MEVRRQLQYGCQHFHTGSVEGGWFATKVSSPKILILPYYQLPSYDGSSVLIINLYSNLLPKSGHPHSEKTHSW